VHGRFDGEDPLNQAMIQFKAPYVLHHEPYREPLASTSPLIQPIPALFAQFQPPAVRDGVVSEQMSERATARLRQLEAALLAALDREGERPFTLPESNPTNAH
jgi:hypothetical protein